MLRPKAPSWARAYDPAMISLSIAVTHHPSRPELRQRVAEQLGARPATQAGVFHFEVVDDPEPMGAPSPWRTAKLAWSRTPSWCTHRLVIQDDAIPCDGFWSRVIAAIERTPDAPLALFFGQNSYHLGIQAYQACDGVYALPATGWVPTVALVLPRDQALDLAGFYLPHHDRPSVADDEVVLEWAYARGLTSYATRPSLVDHDDSQPSLMGTDPTRVRRAVEFVC
jgi:hypothetical protein